MSAQVQSFLAILQSESVPVQNLYLNATDRTDVLFQMGGEQLERVLEDLRGGFPVSPGSLLEDALAGPGQLGLQ